LNGINIADPESRIYQAMIDIAERTLDKAGLADSAARVGDLEPDEQAKACSTVTSTP